MNRGFLTWSLILTTLIVAVALYIGALVSSLHINSDVHIGSESGHAESITIPIKYNTITDSDGITYTIDLGSSHSFLADTTLMRLQKRDAATDTIPTFIYTTCPDEKSRLFGAKYAHDIKIMRPLDGHRHQTAKILGAEFLSWPGCSENVIGIDLLDKFIVEYIDSSQELVISTTMPEGYIPFIDMTESNIHIADGFTYGVRYYVQLAPNRNDSERFRIDSGREMAYMYLLLPSDDADDDSQKGTLQPHECWVDISDRAGYTYANYIDIPTVEPYSLNPFVFFEQDFVIDFPSHQICLRPSSSVYARLSPGI